MWVYECMSMWVCECMSMWVCEYEYMSIWWVDEQMNMIIWVLTGKVKNGFIEPLSVQAWTISCGTWVLKRISTIITFVNWAVERDEEKGRRGRGWGRGRGYSKSISWPFTLCLMCMFIICSYYHIISLTAYLYWLYWWYWHTHALILNTIQHAMQYNTKYNAIQCTQYNTYPIQIHPIQYNIILMGKLTTALRHSHTRKRKEGFCQVYGKNTNTKGFYF